MCVFGGLCVLVCVAAVPVRQCWLAGAVAAAVGQLESFAATARVCVWGGWGLYGCSVV